MSTYYNMASGRRKITRKNQKLAKMKRDKVKRRINTRKLNNGRLKYKNGSSNKNISKNPTTIKSASRKLTPSMIKNTVIIKDETRTAQRLVSRSIHQVVKKNDKKIALPIIDEMIPLVRSDLVETKSFSPDVNKFLVSINSSAKTTNIFGCGLSTPLKGTKFKRNKNRQVKSLFKPTIEINVGSDGATVCVDRSDPRAQKVLLDNLKASGNIDCKSIVAPVQLRANCWFNTMFACFFISDKGKKFFRFFRQLMIEGKVVGDSPIKPQTLSDSFFLLNAAIEASYNKLHEKEVKNLALAMDTNNIITRIYNSIPKNYRSSAIMDVDLPNNPLDYYDAIMSYLGGAKTRFLRVSYQYYLGLASGKINVDADADCYCVEIYDDQAMDGQGKRQLSFTTPNGANYVLDSVIIRDVEKYHFCAVITCGGVEFGYDGASMSRLNKFNWKQYLNKNKDWTFEGSNFNEDKKTPILWNFTKSYQILFYYRT